MMTVNTNDNIRYINTQSPTLIISLIDWTRASAALLSWELASSHVGSGKALPSDPNEYFASSSLGALPAVGRKLFEFS